MIEGFKNNNDKNYFDNFWKTRLIINKIENKTSSPSIDLQRINDMREFDEHMEKIQQHVNTVVLLKSKK
jgi:hypothetical protein